MDGQHIRKTSKDRAHRTIALCALSVHDIWLNLLKFSPNCSDAAKIASLHPTDVRNMETMVVDVAGQLLRRGCRHLLQAGDNVNLDVLWQKLEAFN
jgi:hypothetical protein